MRECRALLRRRYGVQPEPLVQRLEVRLHGLDAELELLGDPAVGRGPARVGQHGAAQRNEHGTLRRADGDVGPTLGDGRDRGRRCDRATEADHRRADDDNVAVLEHPWRSHPLPGDPRPVAGQSVVGDRPFGAESLEHGVRARDLAVPRQRDLAPRASANHPTARLGLEHDQPLRPVTVAEDEERPPRPLRRVALHELLGAGGVRRQRRNPVHGRQPRRITGVRALLAVVLCGLVAGAGALALGPPGAFQDIQLETQFQVRGVERDDRFLFVSIDAKTQDDIRERYPYPRRLHARAIDRLVAGGARQIVYDLVFDQPTTVADDNALIEAVDAAPSIVLATDRVAPDGEVPVLGGRELLRQIGAAVGNSQVRTEAGGVVRDLLPRVLGLDTIAVASARQLGAGPIPTDRLHDGRALIDWAGPPGSIPTVSFSDLLSGNLSTPRIRDKIVIVGAGAPGLGDRFLSTAADRDRLMAGPELQANAVRTALDGLPLKRAAWWIGLLFVVAPVLVMTAAARFRTAAALPAAPLALAAAAVLAQVLFSAGELVDLFAVLIGMLGALAGIAAVTVRSLRGAERELEDLRLRFARAEEGVVDRVLRDPGALGPDGVIGGYRLLSVLGRGGMGVVYRARQEDLGREVALKVIDPRRAEDPTTRERFVREARAAAGVEHPNVVPVYEAGEDGGILYIAMRLVEGPSLAVRLAEHGPYAPADAVELLDGLCAGAQAAHDQGIVHRDIKPANVLVDVRDGREHPYLTDFGVAAMTDDVRLTQDATTVGTFDYLAPEQADGSAPGPAADVYALGCVLFELLTCRVPFPRDTGPARLMAHATAPIPTDGLPDGFAPVIEAALTKDPARRASRPLDLAALAHAAQGTSRRPSVASPRHHQSPVPRNDDQDTIIQ